MTPHGSASTYTNYGCRCDECRAAHRDYWREWSHRTGLHRPFAEYVAAVTRHGVKRYKKGCRCDECRAAAAAQKRRQRARHREHYQAYDRERKRQAKVAACAELLEAARGMASR